MAPRQTQDFVFDDTDRGGIVHVANIKGGVGKSTVATNLASALAQKGPTLVIDLDAQGSATHALGKEPGEYQFSSWNLFRSRYRAENGHGPADAAAPRRMLHRLESRLFPAIVGNGDIASLRIKIHSCLDLVPASADLFNHVRGHHLGNFLYNLELFRATYKYIVIDTPSVWNRLTRVLYGTSDLNLIPVTLNALSTRSLRDYLIRVRNLTASNPNVRVRIVKNEVYGSQESKIKGKTRTMYENRRFLEGLCEQVVIRSAQGVSFLPQSIMFDLEIPESATVRDAQDEGKPVRLVRQYSAISKAFDELAQRVQYVLNTKTRHLGTHLSRRWVDNLRPLAPFAWGAAALLILGFNAPVHNPAPPRPIAPQQISDVHAGVITHVIDPEHTVYRLAKYAICRFRAIVPSHREIMAYVNETVDIFNKTRLPGEPTVADVDHVPAGLVLDFYPPSRLTNPQQDQLVPIYRFFTGMVEDSLAYITGDWCERGTGGGVPHYGIDVATLRGTKIYSPVPGVAVLTDSKSAGRVVGILQGDNVLFFCHMDRRFVKTGDRVGKGTALGTVGMTGATSGPHAHVGYGLRSPARDGIRFGKHNYKLTDPKLFFYRHKYLERAGVE